MENGSSSLPPPQQPTNLPQTTNGHTEPLSDIDWSFSNRTTGDTDFSHYPPTTSIEDPSIETPLTFNHQSNHHFPDELPSVVQSESTGLCTVNAKDSIRVIVKAIDAQVNSVHEMLGYFAKLVKAEKAVQQALLELIPEQKGANTASMIRSKNLHVRGSSSTDGELSKILQNLVSSTNQQARSFSTRALFHKVVTMAQLESLITCHQCLRRTYVECEAELQSQSDQYSTNLKMMEKKYARYVEQFNAFRNKLSGLCDRNTSYHRKTVENLMRSLENVTKKLYLLHNDYVLALMTANHFQSWLHSRLRPCLLNGIERTMRLTCEVIRHLLVFGGECLPLDQQATPSWLEALQTDRNVNVLLQQNSVRFPSPTTYTFKTELLERLSSTTLLPDTLVCGDMTRQPIADLILAYRNRELLHREAIDHITSECLQWEEALAQWRAVFSRPIPNPWASVSFNSASIANETGDGWAVPDIQDLWQDDRARPVNLCEVSYRLTICEFELCFASCLAEAHAKLVTHLIHAQQSRVSPMDTLLSTPPLEGRMLTELPDLLDRPCVKADLSTSVPVSEAPSADPPQSTHASTASLNSSQFAKNHRWHSFRSSLTRLLWPRFIRAGRLRASVGSNANGTLSIPSTVVIDRMPGIAKNVAREMHRRIVSVENGIRAAVAPPPLHSPGFEDRSEHPSSGDDATLCRDTTTVASSNRDSSVQILREPDINKEPWFHGVLPRSEVERLLTNQGDFLVRQTNKRASCRDPLVEEQHLQASPSSSSACLRMVLSVFWNGAHKHFILCGGTPSDNGWSLEGDEFPTIRHLLEHHLLTQTPVTVRSGACLFTPIVRPDWELDNKDVQLVQKIGQGNFGEVYRGFYNGCEVAVKTCRVDMGASGIRQKFLQGERTALNFCHPHIVKLIGIAVRSYPIMIVMEYVPGGSLLNYLRKSQEHISQSTLLLMASDAASGMAYLESKNCIHRDLAARNCLVTETGRLKIADFGMSREEHIYELSDRHGQIPIKWTAPEALSTGRYTIKCDVWSYGVLLWEIFSFGDIPYRFWSNPQTREMVASGYRLPAPDNMPAAVRVQMQNCWLADPEKRPSFAELSLSLQYPTSWNPLKLINTNGTTRRSTVILSHPPTNKFARLSLKVTDKRSRET